VTSGAAKVDPEADPGPRRRSDAISKIDINRASAAELETLPGIGPALARRILDYRRRRPFRSIDHLERVRGIGPATMRKIRDRLTVGASW
jgi:competence protein ComEA